MIIFNHAAYLAQVCYYIGLIAIINKLLQVIFEIVTLIFTVKLDGSYLFWIKRYINNFDLTF